MDNVSVDKKLTGNCLEVLGDTHDCHFVSYVLSVEITYHKIIHLLRPCLFIVFYFYITEHFGIAFLINYFWFHEAPAGLLHNTLSLMITNF